MEYTHLYSLKVLMSRILAGIFNGRFLSFTLISIKLDFKKMSGLLAALARINTCSVDLEWN